MESSSSSSRRIEKKTTTKVNKIHATIFFLNFSIFFATWSLVRERKSISIRRRQRVCSDDDYWIEVWVWAQTEIVYWEIHKYIREMSGLNHHHTQLFFRYSLHCQFCACYSNISVVYDLKQKWYTQNGRIYSRFHLPSFLSLSLTFSFYVLSSRAARKKSSLD